MPLGADFQLQTQPACRLVEAVRHPPFSGFSDDQVLRA